MGVFTALLAFLAALFLPGADGGQSVFESIVATIVGVWYTAGPPAAKLASFIDQIPA